MNHDVRIIVLRTEPKGLLMHEPVIYYAARCSCKWQSPPSSYKDSAEEYGAEHKSAEGAKL